MSWYRLQNESEIDSPALLVYRDRIEQNISSAIDLVGNPERLRPHVKTHKTKQIIKLQLAKGITKFKCATLSEAVMLGECEAPDVLLAYPLVGPKISRFAKLVEKYPKTRFSAIIDHPVPARLLSEMMQLFGIRLDVFIDLDIGMGRTGVRAGVSAIALYEYGITLPGLSVRGFHAYDGHVRESDYQKREQQCLENFRPVTDMIQFLSNKWQVNIITIICGSPSFPIFAGQAEVECSPGTFIFWDSGYSGAFPDQPFVHAAVILARVISVPNKETICIDVGHKSVSAEHPIDQRIHFINAPSLEPIAHSEEHLLLRVVAGEIYQPGDVLYGIPFHVCPTVNLYEQLLVVSQGKADEIWPVTARAKYIE